MKRKIIKQANQAFTLTLPIDWVRKNNISKKSEVDVAIEGKSLIVNNSGRTEIKKVSIDVGGMCGRNISGQITSLYAKGIDEISIKADGDISSDLLRSLNSTIGFALVSQKGNEFIIKDMGGGDYSNLDEIFKRVFQMVLLFYESAIQDIFGKQEQDMAGLIVRDAEINKFCWYMQRAINKMSYPEPVAGRTLFAYAFALEKIGDEIQRLWRTNVKYKVKKTDELKKLVELSYEGLAKAFDFYFQFNPKRAEEIYSLRDGVREKSLKLLKLDSHTVRFVRHIVKIIEDATDLSHLTLMINL